MPSRRRKALIRLFEGQLKGLFKGLYERRGWSGGFSRATLHDLDRTPLEQVLGDALIHSDDRFGIMEFKRSGMAFRTELEDKLSYRQPQMAAVSEDPLRGVSVRCHFALWASDLLLSTMVVDPYLKVWEFWLAHRRPPTTGMTAASFVGGFLPYEDHEPAFGVTWADFRQYVRALSDAAPGSVDPMSDMPFVLVITNPQRRERLATFRNLKTLGQAIERYQKRRFGRNLQKQLQQQLEMPALPEEEPTEEKKKGKGRKM